jgi:hypothetical protein
MSPAAETHASVAQLTIPLCSAAVLLEQGADRVVPEAGVA